MHKLVVINIKFDEKQIQSRKKVNENNAIVNSINK